MIFKRIKAKDNGISYNQELRKGIYGGNVKIPFKVLIVFKFDGVCCNC